MSDVQQIDLTDGTTIAGEIDIPHPASPIVSGELADLSSEIEELRREASEQREKYFGHNKRLKALLCRGLILWVAASKRPDEDPAKLRGTGKKQFALSIPLDEDEAQAFLQGRNIKGRRAQM